MPWFAGGAVLLQTALAVHAQYTYVEADIHVQLGENAFVRRLDSLSVDQSSEAADVPSRKRN